MIWLPPERATRRRPVVPAAPVFGEATVNKHVTPTMRLTCARI
jgi:hypothetical protein